MPNHIQNRIVGEAQEIASVRRWLCRADPSTGLAVVDFNMLIQMPTHDPESFYAEGNIGLPEEEGNPNGNWFDWATACWGTKWNAYGTPSLRDSPTEIYFQTAWAHPRPIVGALAACDGIWRWEWADEDYGSNLGAYICESGKLLFSPGPRQRSARDNQEWAMRLHGKTDDEIREWFLQVESDDNGGVDRD